MCRCVSISTECTLFCFFKFFFFGVFVFVFVLICIFRLLFSTRDHVALTLFIPAGFTQSMQIYTLSTGNFLNGGLTMLVFALGTLPVLALISFSSFSIQNSTKAGIFFKAAGLIVILFAVFNILNTLVAAGYIAPIFNF
jgi:hypothetical protein